MTPIQVLHEELNVAQTLLERSRAQQVRLRRRGNLIVDPADGDNGAPARVRGSGTAVEILSDALPGSVSARAAAVIIRSCLERLVTQAIVDCGLEVGACSMRSKLIVWGALSEDPVRPREAAMLWSDLSEGCHQHAFEYPPNVSDIEALLHRVEELADS